MEPRKDVENSFTRLDLSLTFVAPRHEKKKKRKRRDEINSILAWGGGGLWGGERTNGT